MITQEALIRVSRQLGCNGDPLSSQLSEMLDNIVNAQDEIDEENERRLKKILAKIDPFGQK